MKKIKKFTLVLLIAAVALLSLVSCSGGNVADSGTATVVIETGLEADPYHVYEVDLSKLEKRDEGVLSLLEYIAGEKDSTLYYSANFGGGYGAYIDSIDVLTPDPQSQYVAVYTTVKKDFAVPTEWAPTVSTAKYGEMTLTYSGVGISSMTVNDGTVILFRLEGF